MLDRLTKDSFAPYLGQTFRVQLDPDNVVELELTEVTEFDSRPEQPVSGVRRDPFSIVFRGPVETPLDQGTHHIEHDVIGVIETLFMTPVGADQNGRYYEAVFN